MRRWLGRIGLGLLGVIVLLAGFVAWVLNTSSGTQWAFARVSGVLGGALQAEHVGGTLAGPLSLTNLRYRDPRAGIDVRAAQIDIDVALLELVHRTVHVRSAELRGIDVALSEPTEPTKPSQKTSAPFTLDAPIDLIIDRFLLHDANVVSRGQPLVQIDSAAFAGQWLGSSVAVRQLDVESPQGEVHVTADISQGEYYSGEGRGRFRWQLGTRTFAGSLEADARAAIANVQLTLTAPLDARLDLELQQRDTLPWKFTLDAPRFDPRKELMPDSALHSLAAKLQGEGSLTEAVVVGVIAVNDESIQIEGARLEREDAAIALDSLLKFGGGTLTAQGTVQTAQQPLAADLKLTWADIVVPATLAGQELFTRGDIDVDGSVDAYRASGAMTIGPKQRPANLELRVHGTSRRVQVEQFDIVQTPGRFALDGHVDLQPELAWSMRARARDFDPGAFAAEWPGSLNFDLVTAGSLPEAGLQGTLVVNELNGRLRDRNLGGRVNLALSPGMVIAGDLDLTSGDSRIQLVGKHGDRMNAVATIAVPSIGDWVPNGKGAVQGRIEAQGRWPELTIAGELNGSALQLATLRIEDIAAQWNVDTPLSPAGTATIRAANIAFGDLEFATVRAHAEGDAKRHTLDFAATGEPLATAFVIEGSYDDPEWDGTIQRLVLSVKDAANLTLQQPVNVAYSPQLASISEACLADGNIRLCLQGDRAASGVSHVRYDLQNVPLSLANTFAPASLPLTFAGTLGGSGNIEGTADGAFNGNAEIRSASGRISRRDGVADAAADADAKEEEVLLSYADLNIVANLAGRNANANLAARLNDTGSLQGNVALQGLGEPGTSVAGALTVAMPNLRVIELFVPQLANVQGRADLRASVHGTLADPQLDGEFGITEFAMDVPEIGLKLRNGRVNVVPSARDTFRIDGGISSGPGQIQFAGDATTAGKIAMTVTGKQFQAADIPSANVIIEPDLSFERDSERMVLTGSVLVPSGKIDLQKLPRAKRTQGISPDVVIIGDEVSNEKKRQALPLSADVKVTLGEKVTIVGYGLDARAFGGLAVQERPGTPTTGSGEVSVEGTYKAYGQDLTIQQGQLLFAGTPLDDPRLNIVAVRVIGDVTTGLRVTGSAQNMQLNVFSEPAMGQSDALAYLVTGRSMSEVGQGDASESAALQSAARSLGTAAGGALAKNVGRRLGVDEFGIEDSDAIGGAALTVGQYLSPRLYVSYGIGLFEPGEVLTLRYRLSKELALEVMNGSKRSGAGIEFRRER